MECTRLMDWRGSGQVGSASKGDEGPGQRADDSPDYLRIVLSLDVCFFQYTWYSTTRMLRFFFGVDGGAK